MKSLWDRVLVILFYIAGLLAIIGGRGTQGVLWFILATIYDRLPISENK